MGFDLVTIEHHPQREVLTHVSETVTFPLSQSDRALIKVMEQKVIEWQGVGLAAPQIGVPRKIVVVVIDEEVAKLRQDADTKAFPLTPFINPSYEPTKDAKIVYDWEGCMSVKETVGKVPRYDKIHYRAQRPDGTFVDGIITGFTARVFQHEIDHIEGKLILDRLTPDCMQGHPRDMLPMRYRELDPEARAIYRKYIQEEIDANDPNNQERIEYLKRALKITEAIDNEGS